MRYQGIKVTLITGFLGAGKTTLIRSLLEKAPPHERWAVLVNEFGDIGLDGAFYADLGVAIREVPGGCVCCVTSAAFQQGLNQLVRQYNPDRIFIEPSGLGHPKQIISKLLDPMYQDVFLFTGAFCVLDARNLSNPRYTEHAIFNEQIESADGIVLSHVDRYSLENDQQAETYFTQLMAKGIAPNIFRTQPMGLDVQALDIRLLTDKAPRLLRNHHDHDHDHDHASTFNVIGHYSKQQGAMQVLGWRWSQMTRFDEASVRSHLDVMASLPEIYRIKAVLSLDAKTAVFVNVSKGEISLSHSAWTGESLCEVIGHADGNWVNRVKTCFDGGENTLFL